MRDFRLNKKSIPYLAGLGGIILFVLIYGYRVINPFYIDYLRVSGDLGQHYYGWELYRISDWFVKPGLFNYGSYPYSVSVIFTDSIPIMAVLSKWFLNNYNIRIQYLGVWELLCFFLQGYMGAKLLLCRIDNKLLVFLGSILIILNPCMLRRVFWHTSLSSHFLILLSLYLFEKAKTIKKTKYICAWTILGLLCASIHVYFVFICGLILCAALIRILEKKKDVILYALSLLVAFAGSAFAAIYLLGGTVSGMDEGAPGFGYYSLNLKSFIQPDEDWSSFISNISYCEDGQYEGFVYLGVGTIVLLIIAVILTIIFRKGRKKISLQDLLGRLFLVLGALILSMGTVISFGSYKIASFELSGRIEGLLSIFRANGRLAWVITYVLIIEAIVIVSDYAKSKYVRVIILLCAITLNIIDFYPKLTQKHTEFSKEKRYESEIEDVAKLIGSSPFEYKHIVFLDKDNLSQKLLYDFADYAIDNNMTINDFYFARNFTGNVRELAVKNAKARKYDTIYVLSKDDFIQTYRFDLQWYEMEKVYIGLCGW